MMFYHRGGPFGNWFHGFGPGGFGPRFERGEIKFVILNLLRDKPRHGYEIIQELEKQFHGFYSPSPGAVYPTLQLLEDEELIKCEQKTGKKVYALTEIGKQYLNEHAGELEELRKRMHHPWGERGQVFHELKDEIGQTARLIFSNAAHGNLTQAKLEKIHRAFGDFRKKLEEILNEGKEA